MQIPKVSTVLLPLIFLANFLSAQQLLDQTIMHEGEERQYKIYIPDSYDGSVSFPLVFNFHGGNDHIDSQVAIANMGEIADTANFLIVYPQAFGDPNDGNSANWIHKEPTDFDDVPFVASMIDVISGAYEVDADKIFACGYSLGGEFTYELACRLDDKIAAIAAVARTMGTGALDNCAATGRTGVMTILGSEDSISPYEGLEWAGVQYYLSADDTHDYWIANNEATASELVEELDDLDTTDGSTVERHQWLGEDLCATVEHLKVIGGGHDWPGTFGNMDIHTSAEIWRFFAHYSGIGGLACGATSVGIETSTSKSITAFPNPVDNQLSIESSLTAKQPFEIYSKAGALLLSGQLVPGQQTIDLSNIPAGIYFLKTAEQQVKILKSGAI